MGDEQQYRTETGMAPVPGGSWPSVSMSGVSMHSNPGMVQLNPRVQSPIETVQERVDADLEKLEMALTNLDVKLGPVKNQEIEMPSDVRDDGDPGSDHARWLLRVANRLETFEWTLQRIAQQVQL